MILWMPPIGAQGCETAASTSVSTSSNETACARGKYHEGNREGVGIRVCKMIEILCSSAMSCLAPSRKPPLFRSGGNSELNPLASGALIAGSERHSGVGRASMTARDGDECSAVVDITPLVPWWSLSNRLSLSSTESSLAPSSSASFGAFRRQGFST